MVWVISLSKLYPKPKTVDVTRIVDLPLRKKFVSNERLIKYILLLVSSSNRTETE